MRGNAAQGFVAVGLALALLAPARARGTPETPLPSGTEIVERINARNEGERLTYRMRMTLIDRKGRERVRQTFGYRKYFGTEKRTVLFFESPENVKGTAFLTYDHPEAHRDDDQWLYLPALRKVRRISGADRGDAFIGTDLSYEDMKKGGKIEIGDYTHRTVGVEEVEGHPCYVVEHVPVSQKVAKELGYGRVRSFVDPDLWMWRRATFWDTRGRPLKTIENREIRQVDGIWTVHRVEVENQQTGHRTILTIDAVDYRSTLNDDVFTQRALRRSR